MHLFDLVVQDVALVVVGFTIVYVFSLTLLGIRVSHTRGIGLSEQEGLLGEGKRPSGSEKEYTTYFLVPCLNEDAVIASTIESLVTKWPTSRVVIVDDGSDDATAEIATGFGDQVIVVRRTAPEARQGKGQALNAGIALIRADAARRGLPNRQVLVCVMDADGQLTPNAIEAVSTAFDDPSVGGVQLVVRIRNRDSLMLRFQDMEFWAMSGVGQLGRVASGTVSMGGNGQFTRLYALDEVGERPWSSSLTEDLDLGLSLSILGWKTTCTPGAYVTQQGVDDLGRLTKQRTRWYQGHMSSARRFPELMRSEHLSNFGFFELSAYLAVPWLITLPWSIIQQVVAVRVLTGHGLPNHVFEAGPLAGRIAYAIVWYLISFSPHLFWGWLYWRRAEDVSVGRALMMCHLMIPWSYVSYAAAWRALWRLMTNRREWVKTTRVVESAPSSTR